MKNCPGMMKGKSRCWSCESWRGVYNTPQLRLRSVTPIFTPVYTCPNEPQRKLMKNVWSLYSTRERHVPHISTQLKLRKEKMQRFFDFVYHLKSHGNDQLSSPGFFSKGDAWSWSKKWESRIVSFENCSGRWGVWRILKLGKDAKRDSRRCNVYHQYNYTILYI